MKTLAILTLALFLTLNLYCQDSKVEELVSEGTALHDQGKYDEAIAKYKAALEINKNSSEVNYQMALSCKAVEKYKDAIKYSEKVIDLKAYNLHEAYLVLASSLELLGRHKKAIKAYKEGLVEFPKSVLLNYNLAATYFNDEDYKQAEEYVTSAILANPKYASSHFLLGYIKTKIQERVRALLPLYYYLILEPNTMRSLSAYKTIKNLMESGIQEDGMEALTIILSGYTLKDDSFSSAEMFIGLNGASKALKKDTIIDVMAEFAKTNRLFFDVVERTGKAEKGTVWDYYILKFRDLLKTGNVEAYSYFISQSAYPEIVKKWFSENPDNLEKLKNWMVQ